MFGRPIGGRGDMGLPPRIGMLGGAATMMFGRGPVAEIGTGAGMAGAGAAATGASAAGAGTGAGIGAETSAGLGMTGAALATGALLLVLTAG
ncbi:MAG: hypothetical protein JWR10_3152 [Rubritepida sp.]|nr:hypothetical protein [Rubritepida sp.]